MEISMNTKWFFFFYCKREGYNRHANILEFQHEKICSLLRDKGNDEKQKTIPHDKI